MTTPFGARLRAAMDARGPVCAGIDPHAALLGAWGLSDDVSGLERFAMTSVEALGPEVAVVKPQSAFFERHGSAGVAVLERVVAGCRELGALVLLDVKRGDIGTTAQGYADAYLDPRSPLAADAMTASPYLGFGSLEPMLATAERHGAGVFVLALTSNPEGPQFQHARTPDGGSVAGTVLAELAARNAGAEPWGSHGAVVGATIGRAPVSAEDLDVNGPLLVPGVGAQGGTAESVRAVFGDAVRHVVPSSSREILGAGPDVAALRAAARRTNEQFAALVR
ncbi:orotidine-5'-phosphate decarboxylase [Nocardioides marmoribigeumensis]|uniref:Orotidine 5'-phosphate decarboxylase n=1 Tax=Nocardioides marmoribigeumensis TaxID=433649 RepID=A0ABU2BQT9_9ACTN|nr:orotidine-5'-phosphate decarboxylase [Nocardioides marmoribigeumensis]MDR7360990.1 orotidine-5'-phosphate decarboxylase [Nocardioides marmoribigeumensis]